jgi:hypothetical protein
MARNPKGQSMPDEQTADSSSAPEVEAPEAPGIDTWSDDQRSEWLLTGKTPEAPKTEESAPSKESPAAGEESVETAPQSEAEKKQESVTPKPKGAEARKAQLAAEIQDLLKQRAQLRNETAAKTDEKKPETSTETAKPAAKAADERPTPHRYKTYEEYVEALTDWKVEQKAQAIATERAEAKRTEAAKVADAAWNERAHKAAADPERGGAFDAAVKEIGPFLTQAGCADLIKQSEVGPEILVYLHEHPDETMAIAKSGNPVLVARAIGKIEAKLTPGAVVKTPETKTVTKASKPVTELSGKQAAVEDEVAAAVKERDFAAYQARVNAREIKRT